MRQAHNQHPSAGLLAFCNAVPSVVWSGLSLGPLAVFCYLCMARPWLVGLVASSLLAYAVPQTWFRYWQLSKSVAAYRRLGVPLVNHLAQHGTLVHLLIRTRYPQYRRVQSRRSVVALVANSYHMERFHVAALLFFLFATLYAVSQSRWVWAGLLLLLNMGYNVYPIWLQQYLRLRLPSSKG
ncbi:glycosyl-4,4'-diaponeurosporenoate acyltransferase CrtO family protein [Hymenobacter tenuis]